MQGCPKDKPQYTAEQLAEGKRRMDKIFAPKNQNGQIVPMIFRDDPVQVLTYTLQKPDENGAICPMTFAEDYIDGIPDNLVQVQGIPLPTDAIDRNKYPVDVCYLDSWYNMTPMERRAIIQADGNNQPKVKIGNGNQTISNSSDHKVMVSGDNDELDGLTSVEVVNTRKGMLCKTTKGDILLANFTIEAVEKRIVHNATHEEDITSEYEIKVSVMGFSKNIVITPQNINKVVDIIQNDIPECTVDPIVTKGNALIVNHVRNQLFALSEKHYIMATGLTRINGHWVFSHDGAQFPENNVVFKTGYTIGADLRILPKAAFGFVLKFLAISEKRQIPLMMLLVALLSPMFNLFAAAGCIPRFVLFLCGRTGSFKTSVALEIFRLFREQPNSPEANFKDTATSLEVKMGKANGKALLVDDYRPPVTSADAKENQAKLESIIRSIGDRVTRGRSNPQLTQAKVHLPTGLPVITGEDLGGTQSSQLRLLIVPMNKGDIIGTRLKEFQDHPEWLMTHMHYFLQWVGEHGEEIIEFIRNTAEQERRFFANNLKEYRVIDTGTILMLTAHILHAYGCSVNGFDKGTETQCLYDWRCAILQAVTESEGISKVQNPVCLYLQALFDLVDRKEILIAEDIKQYEAGTHMGYYKDSELWLWHNEVFSAVLKYWQKQGITFPLTIQKLNEHLDSVGLISVDYENRNGTSKKLYSRKSSLPNRNRLMVLNEVAARQYLENENA